VTKFQRLWPEFGNIGQIMLLIGKIFTSFARIWHSASRILVKLAGILLYWLDSLESGYYCQIPVMEPKSDANGQILARIRLLLSNFGYDGWNLAQ